MKAKRIPIYYLVGMAGALAGSLTVLFMIRGAPNVIRQTDRLIRLRAREFQAYGGIPAVGRGILARLSRPA